MKRTYAVLRHDRWSDEEEPRATVITSTDDYYWGEVCTCSPDWAEDIADALQRMEDDQYGING